MQCRLQVFGAAVVSLLLNVCAARPQINITSRGVNWSDTAETIDGSIVEPIQTFDKKPATSVDVDYQYEEIYDVDEAAEDEEDEEEDDWDDTDIVVRPPGLYSDDAVDLGSRPVSNTQLGNPSRQAPEYMLDLYNRFSRGHFVPPTSNIVRSFININKEEHIYPVTQNGQLPGGKTRVHTLVFNITSISMDEVIDHAQLRLYTLVQRDRNTYIGVDRKVSVLEVLSQRRDVDDTTKYRQLSSRHVYGQNSGWEAFDVTSAVKRWVQNLTHVQILEVRIESVFHDGSHGNMDIDTDPTHKNEPLLVVFSNDLQRERLHDTEMHEFIRHESDIKESRGILKRNLKLPAIHHAASGSSRVMSELSAAPHRIVKRSKKNRRNSCRRKPMYVNFQDINWHEWILIPTGYQAFECVGRCYIPMNHHLTPTKHAIIQTLMHTTKIGKTGRACCVPTKLDPISVLYLDENDVITYKYRYDEMIVAECGCR